MRLRPLGRRRRLRPLGPVLAALLLAPAAARAGGFLNFDTTGSPAGWSTAAPVSYWTDGGGLGLFSHAEAVSFVSSTFGAWEAVPTASIAYQRAGDLGVDVTLANYGSYLGPYGGSSTPLGKSVVVFDETGEIFDDFFGVGTGVIGFAGPTFFSNGAGPGTLPLGSSLPPGSRIVEGIAFLNGRFHDGINTFNNPEINLIDLKAVFIHELGHFSGLDHTQVHALAYPPEADLFGWTEPLETMYPYILYAQDTLKQDDAVAISRLYPAPGFAATTGCAAGRVLTAAGAPISGINVVAHNVADDSDSISYVSGYDQVHTGEWSICGLTPGQRYRIAVQEVDGFNRGGSRVGPFLAPVLMPGPPESWSGAAESADPAVDSPAGFAPVTAVAGATVGGLDVRLNTQSFAVTNFLYPSIEGLRSLAPGDFDGDGDLDFVGVHWGFDPGNLVRFSRNLGGGTFAAPVTIDPFPGNFAVVAGQFNPGVDSFLDVVAASSSRREVRVYFGDGAGGFSAPSVALPFTGVFGSSGLLAAGNFNGDAFRDVALVYMEADGTVSVYALLGSASGGFTLATSQLGTGLRFYGNQDIEAGPFAGGAADDLVYQSGETDNRFLNLLVNDGTGHFTARQVSLAAWTAVPGYGIASGDFDGDGRRDVVVSEWGPVGGPPNATRSFLDVLLGDGQGGFRLASRWSVPERRQDAVVAADFDGDGRLDVASAGPDAFGYPGSKVIVSLGDGAGGVRQVLSVWGLQESPGAVDGSMAAGDFDGDGKLDLLVSDSVFRYVTSYYDTTMSLLRQVALPPDGLRFHTLTPCRLVDTRPGAPLASGVERLFQATGACGLPPGAKVLAANVTAVSPTEAGHVALYPADTATPGTSNVNFTPANTRAASTLLRLATDGSQGLRARSFVLGGGSVHLIVDVTGYFE